MPFITYIDYMFESIGTCCTIPKLIKLDLHVDLYDTKLICFVTTVCTWSVFNIIVKLILKFQFIIVGK